VGARVRACVRVHVCACAFVFNSVLTLKKKIQAMRAVAYMHAQRVVHRDISPRNLLVTNAARLFIIDFGLAVDLEGDLTGACMM